MADSIPRYVFSCSLSPSKAIECFDENGDSVYVGLEIIDEDNLVLTYGSGKELFTYSIEIRASTFYRIVCNGERFSEFTWGSERFTRWDSLNAVNRITCLISRSINLFRDSNNLLIAYKDQFPETHIHKLRELNDLWRVVSHNRVYSMYTAVLGLDIDEKWVAPPLLVGNDLRMYGRKLIESTLILSGLTNTSLRDKLIELFLKGLVDGEHPYLYLGIIFFSNNAVKTYSDECLEYSVYNKHFILSNKCSRKLRAIIVGENGFIETELKPGSEYMVSRDLIGCIRDIIGW